MGYVYRAKTGGFYNEALEADYRAAGTWPGFYVRVADDDYAALMEGQANGKVIVPDKNCYPVLSDPPAPTHDELVSLADSKRMQLIEEAMQTISVIQLKQMNGRNVSENELARLNCVLDYIEALEAINTENVPDITWPEAFSDVA